MASYWTRSADCGGAAAAGDRAGHGEEAPQLLEARDVLEAHEVVGGAGVQGDARDQAQAHEVAEHLAVAVAALEHGGARGEVDQGADPGPQGVAHDGLEGGVDGVAVGEEAAAEQVVAAARGLPAHLVDDGAGEAQEREDEAVLGRVEGAAAWSSRTSVGRWPWRAVASAAPGGWGPRSRASARCAGGRRVPTLRATSTGTSRSLGAWRWWGWATTWRSAGDQAVAAAARRRG